MYEWSRTVVSCAVGQTEEFKVEAGLHQGSALSPFLFAIVMDQLSEEVRQESPWTMMFADDIVICSESREQVEENLERWRFALGRRGMKASSEKGGAGYRSSLAISSEHCQAKQWAYLPGFQTPLINREEWVNLKIQSSPHFLLIPHERPLNTVVIGGMERERQREKEMENRREKGNRLILLRVIVDSKHILTPYTHIHELIHRAILAKLAEFWKVGGKQRTWEK
ncbi:hypothetical protein QTP70_004327 [Hemibagrus guttatus]|uniref:ribonuclease H n=1 Tax=Hemibagrus guttatus TaxID=175788 RepID=A0AAE0V501_9TELE|nr:hypothetical protein QTP70_004327 [Hemibagrus guttatus]